MGHSVDVVERGCNKFPTVMTINTKKMGSGVDSVADTMVNLNNAYVKAVLVQEVRTFYASWVCKRPYKQADQRTVDGTDVWQRADNPPIGKIDMDSSNHQKTAGTMMICTENMKKAIHRWVQC